MIYPQVTLSTLEALYRLGTELCDEIEKFHPELILGLAHSGWMPVVVAQTLWAETRENPFPPATRTNIGLEKNEIYVARYGKSTPAFCCGECSDGAGRKGHYLAWVAEQGTWLNTLRTQIEEVFPQSPKRILVVDDTFGGYRSAYTVLTLLEALYPEVNTYIYAGHTDLTDNFVSGWLQQFVPSLAKEIPDGDENTRSRIRYRSPWQEKLKPLITGTEDLAPDRLDWRFISRESPAIKALAGYVPVDIALSAPTWAKELACTYALQRLTGQIKDDAVIEPAEDNHLWPILRLRLYPEDRLAARAWRQNGITKEDIIQIYGNSAEDRRKGFKDVHVKHEWQRQGRGEDAVYFPLVSVESWISAFYPPETPEHRKPEIPVFGFGEFLPGEVWAGAYPIASDTNLNSELFKHLLNMGINSFINLTNPEDFHRKWSYRKGLLQTSQETGNRIKVRFFPMPFRTSPTHRQVKEILEYIIGSLKAGQYLYIHAGHNLDGRTPLILACLLMQRGFSAEKALNEVNTFWSKTLHFLIHTPLNESQQKFVMDWKLDE